MATPAHSARAFLRAMSAGVTGVVLAAAPLGVGGCNGNGGSAGTAGETTTTRPPDPAVTPNLEGRTYTLIAPPTIAKTTPAPLVIMLHDYTDAAASPTPWTDMDTYMQVSPETMSRGWLLALGHGSLDPVLNHFYWNATDACCDVQGAHPDDVGYVMGVVEDIEKTYAVDPRRIFILGYSGGGFMANRLACDQADKFAAVVSLAGETYLDQSKCAASAPIAYLQVQGDADTIVPYAGGQAEGLTSLAMAPGAIQTTRDWAAKNDCSPVGDTAEPQIQLMTTSNGPDTSKIAFNKECQANGWAELWTTHLGPHAPPLTPSWATDVLDFMAAHPRP